MPGDEDEDAALLESLQPNPNLNGLYIRQYGSFRFPSWMVNIGKSLPHLVKLTLEHCSSFECFPLFADQLCHLKVLKLSHLHSLKYIRSYISDSSSSSFKANILSGIGGWFPALQEVNLCSLRQLKEWSRELVTGDDCGKEKTESVGEQRKQLLSLSTLSNLTISHCPELTSMPLFPDVKELMLYNVSEALIDSMMVGAIISPTTETTSSLSFFLTLTKLKSLGIGSCNNVVSLPEGWLENHPSMEYLKISSCAKLESLSLETHHLTTPHMLKDLKFKELDLSEKEDDLQGFRSLRSLELNNLPQLTSLPKGLQHATKLKELSIHDCDSLVSLLDWMRNIRSIQSLDIGGFKALTSLPQGLQHFTALEKLEISNCPVLNFSEEGNDMPSLRSLHSLQLSNLPKLVSLPKVLQHTTSLKNLYISNCPGLITLPEWFGNLTSLQLLEIYKCEKLKSLPEGMHCLTALQDLNILGCPYLSETCRMETGKDWPKISHIPEIYIG